MKAVWVALSLALSLALVCLTACREAEVLPKPFTDAGFVAADSGPMPDGGAGPCPSNGCHPSLYEDRYDGGQCFCREYCLPSGAIPRCQGWFHCAGLLRPDPQSDSGFSPLDSGICRPGAGPGEACSPSPCADLLWCVNQACRWRCDPTEDAGIEDAVGAELIPLPNECPAGQGCHDLHDAGVCL